MSFCISQKKESYIGLEKMWQWVKDRNMNISIEYDFLKSYPHGILG